MQTTTAEAKQVSLYYQDDRSDKEYHLQLEPKGKGWVVNFQFGRRESTLQTGSKTKAPVTLEKADKIYNRIPRDKLGKGYHEDGAAKAAPHSPTDASAVTDFPVELLTEVPQAQVIALLENEAYWLQEKRDGQRRQIAKQDGHIIGYNRKGTAVALPANLIEELSEILLHRFVLDGEIEGDQFIAFDLLGTAADSTPYAARFALLIRLIKGLRSIHPVATWRTTAEKERAAVDLHDARAEGLVFKRTEALYRAGRNGQHYKFKFVKTLSAKVLRVGDKGKQSVAVGPAGWQEVDGRGHRQHNRQADRQGGRHSRNSLPIRQRLPPIGAGHLHEQTRRPGP